MVGHAASLTLLLLLGGPGSEPACDVDLAAWLACNNPRAIKYLGALSVSDIGTVLSGVELTDGSFVAKGYRLLALPTGLGKGAHIVVVRRPAENQAKSNTLDGFLPGGEGAFVWVNAGGDPLVLPECPRSSFENQYVLSGDVYTWKAVQPDHGVVEVGCIFPSWKHGSGN